MIGEEHEIIASALEAEAILQEQGDRRRVGGRYDFAYRRILWVNSAYDESVAFAFTFWDNWVDAASHNWRHHAPFTERDWPCLARETAAAVRRGQIPSNGLLMQHLRLQARRSFWQRLAALVLA